jgi:hypothetical protein
MRARHPLVLSTSPRTKEVVAHGRLAPANATTCANYFTGAAASLDEVVAHGRLNPNYATRWAHYFVDACGAKRAPLSTRRR